MADYKTIEQFLVGIGFRIDENGARKLESTLNQVASLAKKFDETFSHHLLGVSSAWTRAAADIATTRKGGMLFALGAITGAVTATGAALVETAKHFSNLYYTAQRSGASVRALEVIGYAAQQAGIQGEAAQGQIAALAGTLRDNPALKAFMGAEQITGNNPAERFLSIIKRYHELLQKYGSQANFPEMIQRQINALFGVNNEQIRQLAMNYGAFTKGIAQGTQIYKPVDLNRLANESIETTRHLHKLTATLDAEWDKLATRLMPVLDKSIVGVNTALQAASPIIDAYSSAVEKALAKAYAGLARYNRELDPLWKKIEQSRTMRETRHVLKKPILNQGLMTSTSSLKNVLDSGIVALYEMLYGPLPPELRPSSGEHGREKTPAGMWQKFYNWLSGQTHSPHVEITGANESLWQRFAQWLLGSQGFVPWVKVKRDAIISEVINTAAQLAPGGLVPSLGEHGRPSPAPGEHGRPSPAPGEHGRPSAQGSAIPLGAPSAAIASPGTNKRIAQAVDFFTQKGVPLPNAEGIVARLYAESKLDPNIINKSSGAYGIAQWLGPRKPAALATHGDFLKQLQLVWQEFQSTEHRAFAEIMRQQTAYSAATAMEAYERAGNPAFTAHAGRIAAGLADRFKEISKAAAPIAHAAKSFHAAHPQLDAKSPYAVGGALYAPAPLPIGAAPKSPIGQARIGNLEYNATINVHGSGQATGAEIGSYVFGAQRRLNGNLIRNLTTSIT